MIRFFLPLILLSTFAAAQTVGQYEIRKRGASGFTSYGVTLSNGQVFGQTAGSPAAITPFGGAFSDLSGKPTTLNGYGITDGLSTSNNLSDLANAATARTNLGLGAAATLATSTGGNYTADGGKALIFGSFGEADISRALTIHRINSGGWLPGVLQLEAADNVQAVLSPSDSMGSFQTFTLPAVGGTLIGTGNLTAITATGTITSGTWQGSIIAPAYLGTGSDITTKYLRGDGTWQTLSTGLTIGTTTTSGASAGDILTSDGTNLQKLTPGTGVSAWLATPSKANLNAAVSDDDPAYLGTANAFTATQTVTKVSASASAPHFKAVGYGVNFSVYDDDGTTLRTYISQGDVITNAAFKQLNSNYSLGDPGYPGLAMCSSQLVGWSSHPSLFWSGTRDLLLSREGAGHLAQSSSTTAQRLSVFNTYTSPTSHEAFTMDWQTTANTVRVGTVKGSGGGTARQIIIQTDGTERIRISAVGEIFLTLPTSAGTPGSLWNDAGTVKVSP
jgi:hypothetical protein